VRRRLAGAVVAATACLVAAQGVRVVDSVVVGQPADEAAHRFVGEATTTGTSAGRTWRSAAGWFSYSLRIYDDSPLTVVCRLAGGDGAGETFDILVDGRKVTTVRRSPGESKAAEVRVNLALGDTEGKTSVIVKVAAHAGLRTGRVEEIRTVQEHLE